MKAAVLCCTLLALCPRATLAASPLLFDGFESWNRGALDANFPSGPNAALNAGANPWWGPYPPGPPDLLVVAAETNIVSGVITNLVTPHGGTNMVRGKHSGSPDFDQNFFNIAWRLNQGKVFAGNVSLDWWFFDPVGANTNTGAAPQYQDFASLAYYTAIPLNADYHTNNLGQATPGFATTQFSIGASTSRGPGYISTNYQAQIYPTTSSNAYDPTNGWFNLPVARTAGWHHARISVPTTAANGAGTVSFYVDNLASPALTNTASLTNGLNCILLSAENGSLTGYFDDLTCDFIITPVVLSITPKGGSNAILTWPGTNWTLQFSTNTNPTAASFTDLPTATSPYTNSFTNRVRFFRLRQ
jgi:hypothetical protein